MLESLKKIRLFQFASSVKLSVPLMIGILIVVAVGTVIESRTNAQIASLLVYRSWWFELLMAFLWLNIFFATVARWPFERRHAGFVIIHAGLLALLAGGLVTSRLGLDGSLRVLEGQSNHRVSLPELTLDVVSARSNLSQSYDFKRSLQPLDGNQMGLSRLRATTGLVVERYLPFVVREQGYVAVEEGRSEGAAGEGVFVDFSLDGGMFGGAREILHSVDRPNSQLGPALFRLIGGRAPERSEKKEPGSSSTGVLWVKDAGGKELGSLPLSILKKGPQSVQGVRISLIRMLEQAVVADNRLTDKGQKGANPAVEVRLEKDGRSFREVAFAKFPGFSLSAARGEFGIQLEYQPAEESGSRFDFYFLSQEPSVVQLEHYRAGKKVFSSPLGEGQTVEVPSFGAAKIRLNSLIPRAVVRDEIKPAAFHPRTSPEGAILIRHESMKIEDALWISEGEYKTVRAPNAAYEVYFGMKAVELPFSIFLEKFEKKDYPGTETPMSFESTVKVNGAGQPIRISMNEPLRRDGYMLYQSSYELGQGIPTASIFSVNRDPGRGLKYFGSLILCLGIIVFAVMKGKKGSMKTRAIVFLGVLLTFGLASTEVSMAAPARQQVAPEQALIQFKAFASRIDSAEIAALPVQNRGRLKPLHSFARETVLFLTGKYGLRGLDAVQFYLGLVLSPVAADLEIIQVRDPDLRVRLGFSRERRNYSLNELEQSGLGALDPERAGRDDKAAHEAQQQIWLMRGVLSGRHFGDALIFSESGHSPVTEKLQAYLKALETGDQVVAKAVVPDLLSAAAAQPMPELFQKNVGKMGLEVWFNKAKLFFLAALGYLLIGIPLMVPFLRKFVSRRPVLVLALVGVPFSAHILGFVLRVYITGFAPVTNMYGTMVWVAFGVTLFGSILFAMYRNFAVFGGILLGAALTLFLTESLPLVLSPDMDPIVAVLRNNFWLTLHVLTITISYAAFTISMLLGNAALVRGIVSKKDSSEERIYQEWGKLNYRMIQLGVFFLTAGIILGGIWADYSWGRFWGWDPKETWALIADLGYLAILHARYLGWLKPFGVLAASPVAYLLVVMAWFGVNFILASGLHSYGFSSGGATLMGVFVALQLGLLGAAGVVQYRRGRFLIC